MKLVAENDPILKIRTPIFDFDNPPVDPVQFAADLYACMKEHPAIGLAAPQVGLSYRVFTIETRNLPAIICFNPEIVASSETVVKNVEGCLSFPDLILSVRRPDEITVRYQNQYGETVEMNLQNLEGRAFQHELDHVNGITFDTKVSPLSLQMAKKRRSKR